MAKTPAPQPDAKDGKDETKVEPIAGGVVAASIEASAAGQIEDAPDANLAVVNKVADGAPNASVIKDSAGTIFNPQEHERLPDGQPRKTKAGLFARKRGGFRKGSIGSVAGDTDKPVDASAQQGVAKAPSASMVASAGAATSMTFMCGMMIGGDEWKPGPSKFLNGTDEAEFMQGAWLAYFQAKGVEDLPPGLALCFAMFIYVAPRFTQPKTSSRAKQFGAWCAMKWHKWRGTKTDGTHADKRNNGIREINLRQEAPQSSQESGAENHSVGPDQSARMAS